MDAQIELRLKACDDARDPEWEASIEQVTELSDRAKAYLNLHPPGLVRALWSHFEATRDKCGCATVSHEREGCAVRLIERILLEEQSQ
jgi:hypothetical protein